MALIDQIREREKLKKTESAVEAAKKAGRRGDYETARTLCQLQREASRDIMQAYRDGAQQMATERRASWLRTMTQDIRFSPVIYAGQMIGIAKTELEAVIVINEAMRARFVPSKAISAVMAREPGYKHEIWRQGETVPVKVT